MKLAINPSPLDVNMWEKQWVDWLAAQGRFRGETAHWDWLGKLLRVGPDGNIVLLALVDDDDSLCDGLMMIKWPMASRLAPDGFAAHVEYLEIAPWNRAAISPARVHKGIGTLLISYAVMCSEDWSLEGRVNLCSLPQAEGFYERIGMIACGTGAGYDRELTFFELPAMSVEEFLNGV